MVVQMQGSRDDKIRARVRVLMMVISVVGFKVYKSIGE